MTTEPRPKFTPEIALAAARLVVADLMEGSHLVEDADVEKHAKDIAKHARQHADGYEIAKALDIYCYWNCTFEVAEILNSYSSAVDTLIQKAQKEWAARNDVQPPLPVGTRVKTKDGETGIIDQVYEYGAAQFCVKLDNDPRENSRRIVNFEDALPLRMAPKKR